MTWKSTAAVSGVGLLLTWLANVPSQQTPPPSRAAVRPAAARSGVDIQEQADRLRSRMHTTADYSSPARNPFRFGAMSAAHQRSPVAAASVPVEPPAPPLPPRVTLSGIATDIVDGREQRTAILKTPSGLAFVHEGEEVAGQYRVRSISEDAVELIGTDGAVLRLR